MASTFSFGFSGDDIDMDESELNDVQEHTAPVQNADDALPASVEPKRHDMGEWVSLFHVSFEAAYMCMGFPSPLTP